MIKKRRVVEEDDTPKTNLKTVQKLMKGLTRSDKFINLQPGDNIIRILPSRLKNGSFYLEKVTHYGFKDAEGGRAYPCLLALDQDVCPVCETITLNEAEANADDDIKEILEGLAPRTQYLMNAIDRGEDKPLVKLLNLSAGVMKDIAGFLSDPDYGDITDAKEGYDLRIVKIMGNKPIDTRYKVRARPKPTPIGLPDWADHLYDLEKEAYREIPTLKEYVNLIDKMYGNSGLEIPEYKFAKSKKKGRKVEDEDEELEEEDEEEERPVKKSAKKKKVVKKVVEEEEEEEEEDDDFEDEEEDEDDD